MRRVLGLSLAVVVLAFSPRASLVAAQPPQGERFLGFEIGEERRYVLGPEDALGRSERGKWLIRLDEVFEIDGEPEGLFALSHEWSAPPPIGDVVLGRIRDVKSAGSVRVNGYGFPLMIQFQTRRHLDGMGEEAYTIDFRLDDDHRRYEKRTTARGERWYQNVSIRRHGTVDLDGPVGLFAFLPGAPGCLDSPVQRYDRAGGGAYLQPRSAGSPSNPVINAPTTVKITDNSGCEESMFAHPGLLSLAMPALWEAQGEREYLFFTPIGPVGEPRTGVSGGIPVPGGGIPYGPGSISQPGGLNRGLRPPSSMGRLEADPLSNSTYHETETLTFIERVSVEIGGRTTDAWLIEISDHYGPIYVDDDGGVMRIDLPPVPGAPERWIRMLWPSEF